MALLARRSHWRCRKRWQCPCRRRRRDRGHRHRAARCRRAATIVSHRDYREFEQGANEDGDRFSVPSASRHPRLEGGGSRLARSRLGADRHDDGILDLLRLDQAEDLGAEILRPVGPAQAAARHLAEAADECLRHAANRRKSRKAPWRRQVLDLRASNLKEITGRGCRPGRSATDWWRRWPARDW